MRKLKKTAVKIIVALLLGLSVSIFTIGASAACDRTDVPEGYGDVIDVLPDEAKELLPDDVFSDDIGDIGKAVKEMSGAEYIFSILGEITGIQLGQALRLLAQLMGILLLSAVFGTMRGAVKSEALAKAVGYCTTCAVFATITDMQYRQLCEISEFFSRLNTLMLSMIPVTGAVYAMGGNVATAAASGGTLYAFLAVSEKVCAATVIPIGCVCTALALCQTLAPSVNVRGINGAVKKSYTFILGLIMTVLVAVLGAQTTIASAADSTAARAAKLVTSSVIPIVGGSVGDTLRTVGAGVSYMRSVIGVAGIVFILLLVLPTLISILLTRLAFMLAGGAADILGCENESKLLSELGGVLGMFSAVVSMVSAMFIIALTIFIKCVAATG